MIQFTREGYVSKLVNKGSSTASLIAKWYSAGFDCVEFSGSIPSQGPRHTNDVIKMVAKAVVQHCYPWWRSRWSP